MVDLATFQDLLAKRSPEFWTYVRNWKFLIVHTAQFDKAMVKMKPSELGFCRIRDVGGVTSFQIGEACLVCPPGIRTVLRGPFAKTWADGNLYVASIPEFEFESDSAASPDRSPLALCESERRLWPSIVSFQTSAPRAAVAPPTGAHSCVFRRLTTRIPTPTRQNRRYRATSDPQGPVIGNNQSGFRNTIRIASNMLAGIPAF